MQLSGSIKQQISIEVIKTLVTMFENFPEDASNNRNAPFHGSFLKEFSDKLNENVSISPFFISLSSWLQGLNTTVGQVFFKNVSHNLRNAEIDFKTILCCQKNGKRNYNQIEPII